MGWGGVRWGEVRWSGLLISKLQLMSEMEDLLTFSRCHLSCGLFTMGEGAAQSLVRKDGARQAKVSMVNVETCSHINRPHACNREWAMQRVAIMNLDGTQNHVGEWGHQGQHHWRLFRFASLDALFADMQV